MAGGFWRGQAAQMGIHRARMEEYLAGMPGGLEQILGGMFDAYAPYLEDIMGQYYNTAATMGQAVPGKGFSGAAMGGMENIFGDIGAQMLGTAMQAYTQPWGPIFGATGKMAQQYQASRGPGAGQFLGQFAGMGMGALGTGIGFGIGGPLGGAIGGGIGKLLGQGTNIAINPNQLTQQAGDDPWSRRMFPYMFDQ